MKRGHTLIELLVAMGLLSLMLASLFYVYTMGANALQKGLAETDLVQQAQIFHKRLGQEVQRSIYAGTSLDPPSVGTALALLSCWDDATQQVDYDATARAPRWHKYLIFYYDAPNRRIMLKEKPLATPSSNVTPLTGLAAERSGGRPLAQLVSRCEFRLQDGALDVLLITEKTRYGKSAPEQLNLPATMYFRL